MEVNPSILVAKMHYLLFPICLLQRRHSNTISAFRAQLVGSSMDGEASLALDWLLLESTLAGILLGITNLHGSISERELLTVQEKSIRVVTSTL